MTTKDPRPPEKALRFSFAEPSIELEVLEARELLRGLPVPVKNQSGAVFVTHASTGRQFVLKHGISESDVRGESLGWALSQMLGVWTPAPALVREGRKLGWCSELVRGASAWRASDATSCSPEDVANIFVLDAILGNTDRHEENVLVVDPGGGAMYRVLSIDLANSWLGGGDGGPFATQVDTVPDDPQFLRGVDVEVIEGAARNILARASSLAADPAKVAASLYAANLATKLDSERSLKKIQGAVLQRLASAEDLFSLFLGATLSRRLP